MRTRLALLCIVLLVMLTACGDDFEDVSPDKAGDSIRVVEGVEMRGRIYDCIVYDRKAYNAGMGGLWCERREQ